MPREHGLAEHPRARREVGGAPVGMLFERSGLVREDVRLGDALPLHEPERLAGLEPLLHHPGTAGGEGRAHRRGEAGRPEDRERAEHPGRLVAPEEVGDDPPRQRDGPVAEHHALRSVGRSRAVDDDPEIRRADLRGDGVEELVVHRVGRAGGTRPTTRVRTRPLRDRARHAWRRYGYEGSRTGGGPAAAGHSAATSAAKWWLPMRRLEEQHAEVGVREQVRQLGLRRERRQRHGDRTRERSTEQSRHRLGSVPHEDADPGALPDARPQQGLRDAAGMVEQVRVGPPHGRAVEQGIVEDQRLVLGEPRGLFDEDAAEGEGADPGGVVQGWARERRRLPHGGDSTPP